MTSLFRIRPVGAIALIFLLGASMPACSGATDDEGPPAQGVTGSGNGDSATPGDGDGDESSGGDGDSNSGSSGASGDGDGDGGASTGGSGIELPPGPDPIDPPEGYPAGPYGTDDPEVGDVVENLTFEGFPRIGDGVLVNQGEIETITFEDIRNLGKRYALVHTATLWCPSCRTAADDLSARGDELSAMDAVLVELVLEGNGSLPPTDTELDTWVVGSDLTVMTIRTADERGPIVFPSREYAYVIDLDSMTVVWAMQALFSDPSITEEGIDALLDVLN